MKRFELVQIVPYVEIYDFVVTASESIHGEKNCWCLKYAKTGICTQQFLLRKQFLVPKELKFKSNLLIEFLELEF